MLDSSGRHLAPGVRRDGVRKGGGVNLQSLSRPNVSRSGSRSSFNGDSFAGRDLGPGGSGGLAGHPPELKFKYRGRERTSSRPASRERPTVEVNGRPGSRRGSYDRLKSARSRSASRSRATSPSPGPSYPSTGLSPYRPSEPRGGGVGSSSHYTSGAEPYSVFSTHMKAKPPAHSSPKAPASSASRSFERPRFDRQYSNPSRSPTNRAQRVDSFDKAPSPKPSLNYSPNYSIGSKKSPRPRIRSSTNSSSSSSNSSSNSITTSMGRMKISPSPLPSYCAPSEDRDRDRDRHSTKMKGGLPPPPPPSYELSVATGGPKRERGSKVLRLKQPRSGRVPGLKPPHDGFRGLTGLKNLGNTCFMNSVLQCLVSTLQLNEYFTRDKHMNDLCSRSPTKGKLAVAFANLTKDLGKNAEFSSQRPDMLKRLVGSIAPQFANYGQHDSQEFLRFLLDGLHDDLNRIKTKPEYEEIKDGPKEELDESISQRWWTNYMDRNSSIMTDLFVGQLSSTIMCRQCQHISKAFDPFWDLSLPVPKLSRSMSCELVSPANGEFNTSGQCSLLDCFNEYTKEEFLDGNNQVFCSKCKAHQDCTKQLSIFRFPRVLVVHLKRYAGSAGTKARRSKLNTTIAFPSRLDLTMYLPKLARVGPLPIYGLYAVSNHMGGTGGGHYTAHCNVSASRDIDGWFTFNDSQVHRVPSGSVGGSSAYVLFYVRI